jgi:hypothetical protein
MLGGRRRGALRRAAGWLAAAVLLWLAAGAADRRTVVVLDSDGGTLHLEVAGSRLSAPLALAQLTAIEIRAAGSIDPPGGGRIVLGDARGRVLDERLPRSFRTPREQLRPLGDWEIDARAVQAAVWRRELTVAGPFVLRIELRGRFPEDLEIVLHGRPGARVAVRRGLINNDLFLRDAAGRDLAVTSLDPTPLADLGAIAATLARAAAVAALLIAVGGLLAASRGSRLVPVAVRRRGPALAAAACAAAAAALSGWVAVEVLEGLPHTPDEVVYLLQARWLVEGRLWGEAPGLGELLTIPYTYPVAGRLLPHYPPAWPALLAPGVAAGASWAVAPLLGGLLVWLLFLTGRELESSGLGLLAAGLGLLCPLARLLSGSLLSHAAAAAAVLAGVLLALRAESRGSRGGAATAGLAVGLAVALRPLSGAAAALPLAAGLVAGPGGRRALPWFGAGLLTAVLPAFAANRLITGSPLAFPYALADGPLLALENLAFGLRNLDALLIADGASLTGWGWGLLSGPWLAALAFALPLVPFLVRRATAGDRLLAAIVLCVMAAHLGTRGHGLHGFGPRYHFEAFAPLLLLTARGLSELTRGAGDPRGTTRPLAIAGVAALVLALALPAAAALPGRLALYRGYNGVDGSLSAEVTRQALRRAVIVLPPDEWQGWAMAAPFLDTRPGASLLVVQAAADDPRVLEIAADRPVFAWQDRTLTPIPHR